MQRLEAFRIDPQQLPIGSFGFGKATGPVELQSCLQSVAGPGSAFPAPAFSLS